MGRAAAIVALAAAASGFLFLSLIFGAAAAPFLAYFIQLPLLFCGLALGLGPAGVASAGAALITFVASGFVAGAVFLLIEAAPVLLLVRQALLWRKGENGRTEWYPPGRLITDLSLAALVVSLLSLWWLASGEGGVAGLFDEFVRSLPSDLSSDSAMAQAHMLFVRWAHWLPGVIGASWVLMTVLNAIIAQQLALRSGMAKRPTPDIAEFEVPGWCGIPLLASVPVVALSQGGLAAVAILVLVLFSIPFLFQGLGVVHALSRKHAPSRLPIIGFYVLFVLFSWPLVLLVVLLGLAEEWAGLRRRYA
jgi:hypothetical protein